MTMQKPSISITLYPRTAKKSPNEHFHSKRVKSSNFYSIFANFSPILIKLGMGMHICLPKLTSKKSLRISKSKTTDGTQLEKANKSFHAKLVKYSNFYSIFANVWPILMKFGTAIHIRLQKLMCEKVWNFNHFLLFFITKQRKEAWISVFMSIAWNIQTFTISLHISRPNDNSRLLHS